MPAPPPEGPKNCMSTEMYRAQDDHVKIELGMVPSDRDAVNAVESKPKWWADHIRVDC